MHFPLCHFVISKSSRKIQKLSICLYYHQTHQEKKQCIQSEMLQIASVLYCIFLLAWSLQEGYLKRCCTVCATNKSISSTTQGSSERETFLSNSTTLDQFRAAAASPDSESSEFVPDCWRDGSLWTLTFPLVQWMARCVQSLWVCCRSRARTSRSWSPHCFSCLDLWSLPQPRDLHLEHIPCPDWRCLGLLLRCRSMVSVDGWRGRLRGEWDLIKLGRSGELHSRLWLAMSWVWSSLGLADKLVVLELFSMELVQIHSHGVEVVAPQGSIAMAWQSLDYGVVVMVPPVSVARVLRKAIHGLFQVAQSGGVPESLFSPWVEQLSEPVGSGDGAESSMS